MSAYSEGGWLSLKSPVGFDWAAATAGARLPVARKIVPVDVDCIVVLLKFRMSGMRRGSFDRLGGDRGRHPQTMISPATN
jgi:hypothetical protein